ncbi:MAG: Rab family GTPase [Candidatus Thorarchaeota archaeon]
MTQRKLLYKVVIVGDGGVGKSTMVQRLTTGQYIPQKITIGTDLATKDVEIDNKLSVRLQIWDFAGERRFRLFLPNYARGAVGCLLCYDITRRISFESLKEWYKIVNDNANNPVFILVGEKLDLADNQRSISSDQAEEFKKNYNIEDFFETSSKNGKNNKKIFKTLTRAILEKKGII